MLIPPYPPLKGAKSEINGSCGSGEISQMEKIDKKTIKARGLITNGYCIPYNPQILERAKELRKNMTVAEEKLWKEFLKDFKYRVRRQKQIDNFIVDFYCSKLKLVIEIDGPIHDLEERIEYDEERSNILQHYGLKILRFKNEEVIMDFDSVCTKIKEYKLGYES